MRNCIQPPANRTWSCYKNKQPNATYEFSIKRLHCRATPARLIESSNYKSWEKKVIEKYAPTPPTFRHHNLSWSISILWRQLYEEKSTLKFQMKQFAQLSWSNFPSLCCSPPLFMCGAAGWAAGARMRCRSRFSSQCLFVFFLKFISVISFFLGCCMLTQRFLYAIQFTCCSWILMVLLSGMFVLCKCLFNSRS